MVNMTNNPNGYGYWSFAEAMSTFDHDNPPIGEKFKICGQVYILKEGLKFEEVENGR